MRNSPLSHKDPDGHIIDTLADIGFIAYDLYQIGKGSATTTNVLALGADVVGAAVPFATGLGVAVRAEHAVEVGVQQLKRELTLPKVLLTQLKAVSARGVKEKRSCIGEGRMTRRHC